MLFGIVKVVPAYAAGKAFATARYGICREMNALVAVIEAGWAKRMIGTVSVDGACPVEGVDVFPFRIGL